MFRKCFLLLAGAAAFFGAAGCRGFTGGMEPHSRAGLHIEYLDPAVVVSAPNITAVTASNSSGLVGIDHQSAMTALPAPTESSAMMQGTVSSSRVRSTLLAAPAPAGPNPCTLQDVCERIERLERQRAAPPAQRMPPGE